jgi:hypothetical protein
MTFVSQKETVEHRIAAQPTKLMTVVKSHKTERENGCGFQNLNVKKNGVELPKGRSLYYLNLLRIVLAHGTTHQSFANLDIELNEKDTDVGEQ